jgi:large subunit ribosomal protein L5
VGAGKDATRLEKSIVVLKELTGIDPVKTISNKRIPNWGVRPGLPVGCMLTLRRQPAQVMLKRLLKAKDFKLAPRHFDEQGNVSFGITEYIDIEGARYDPKIGMLGLQVCVTLEKPGHHVKRRRARPSRVGKVQRITKEESMEFMKREFGVSVAEESA